MQSFAGELDSRPRRRHVVACGVGFVDRLGERGVRGGRVAQLAQGHPELAEDLRPLGFAGREQGRGTAEEVGRRPGICSLPRADPGRGQHATCALRETDDNRIAGVELLAVAMRLLEVVADDLVRGFVSLLEPGAEAFVQLRPCVLRRPGVGDVADQDVMEAVRVVVASTQGTNEAASDECHEPRVESRDLLRRGQREKSATGEVSARDGRAFGERPLGRVEALESTGEQRLDRRRNGPERAGTGLLDECEQLLEEKRVPRGNPDDLRPCLVVEGLGRDLLDQHAGLRLRPAAPGRGLRSSSPIRAVPRRSSRRARQSTSSAASAGQESRYSMRSRNVGSAQWMSSSRTTTGRSRASASRKRRTAQNTSPVEAAPSAGSVR